MTNVFVLFLYLLFPEQSLGSARCEPPCLTQADLMQLSNCPFCGPQYNWGQYPYMNPYMPFQYQAPWWAMYGSLSYPNFYFPGAWSAHSGGVHGGMYPGNGNMFAAKPNLYLYTKKNTKLDVQVKIPKNANWLLAVPPHEKKGWEITTQAGGKLKDKDTIYDYLFYDLRGFDEIFQDQAGYCVAPEELIPKLVKDLTNAGFRKDAIEDFVNHWNFKIASSEKYCVYPQSHVEIEKAYKIKTNKKIHEQVRLWFVVVPEEFRKNGPTPRFKKIPEQDWSSPYLGAKRTVAKAGDVEAFEWAVCFLAGTSSAKTQ